MQRLRQFLSMGACARGSALFRAWWQGRMRPASGPGDAPAQADGTADAGREAALPPRARGNPGIFRSPYGGLGLPPPPALSEGVADELLSKSARLALRDRTGSRPGQPEAFRSRS